MTNAFVAEARRLCATCGVDSVCMRDGLWYGITEFAVGYDVVSVAPTADVWDCYARVRVYRDGQQTADRD